MKIIQEKFKDIRPLCGFEQWWRLLFQYQGKLVNSECRTFIEILFHCQMEYFHQIHFE